MVRNLIVLVCLGLVAASCSGSDTEDDSNGSEVELPADDELTQDTVLFDGEAGEGEPGDGESGDGDIVSGEEAGSGAGDGEPEADPTPAAPAATPSVVIYRFGVLGGWTGSDWDDRFPESAGDVGISAGNEFQVVGVGTDDATVIAGEPTMICDPIGSFGVATDPPLVHDWETGVATVGVNAAWDANPRSATISSGGTDVYVNQIAELLTQNGIDPALAVVDQVARIDLEGDGVDEVVLTANRSPAWPIPEPGNYSLVLLRKLVEEQVQTAVLFQSFIPEETDEFFWERANLIGFADLNGDAKLEILVSSQYYEGDGIQAFEYVNDDLGPVPVLGSGCGA